MKHPYGIGLDIGIASVGWAVVALNETRSPMAWSDAAHAYLIRPNSPKQATALLPRAVRPAAPAAGCAAAACARRICTS